MKKFLTILLTVVLTTAVAVTGTVAYLQDTEEDINTMVLGSVQIEQNEYEREVKDGVYTTKEIDGKNSYVLKEFTQDKPLYPATELDANGKIVNFGAGDWDATTVRMSQVGSQGGMQVFKTPLAVDKFVTVKNTGKTDAYVRTLIAFELGSVAATDFDKVIGHSVFMSDKDGVWETNEVGTVVIDGNNYLVVEYLYKGGAHIGGVHAGYLPAEETTYPCLSQVYMVATATNEDCEAIDGNKDGKYNIIVLSQAVQVEGFADAKTALTAGFGAATVENATAWFNA